MVSSAFNLPLWYADVQEERPGRRTGMAIVHVIRETVRGCNTVAFDAHALQRMQERGVTEDEVLDVLRNPTQTGLPTTANRLRQRKTLAAGGYIGVVVEEDPTQIVVITVIRGELGAVT